MWPFLNFLEQFTQEQIHIFYTFVKFKFFAPPHCFNAFMPFFWSIVLGQRRRFWTFTIHLLIGWGAVQTRPRGKRKWGVTLNTLTHSLIHPWNHLIGLISSLNALPEALQSNFISLTDISASPSDVFISLHSNEGMSDIKTPGRHSTTQNSTDIIISEGSHDGKVNVRSVKCSRQKASRSYMVLCEYLHERVKYPVECMICELLFYT